MVLTFANENYIKIYEGLLENKTTAKVQVFGDIYPTEYMGKQMIHLGGEISATTKLVFLSQKLCCRQSKQHRVIDTSFRL